MAGHSFQTAPLLVSRSRWQAVLQHQIVRSLLNIGLVAAWLALFRPIFPYLKIIATRHDFRTNQIILVGIVILLVIRILDSGERPNLAAIPQLVPIPLLLVGLSAIGFLVNARFFDVNTLAATLFGIGSYGLIGLWLPPQRWKAGLPAALLMIAVLPFGDHMQTFVGYPVRLYTAQLVAELLAIVNITSVGVDTILVFENGVSHIDLPCSGVKSLWTGGIFLLAITWIEQRQIGWRWGLIALLFTLVLLAGNLLRVLILTVAGPVFGLSTLAEVIHVPLGVLTFVIACLLAVFLLRWAPLPSGSVFRITPQRHAWLAPLLIALLLVGSLLYVARPVLAVNKATVTLTPPTGVSITPQPLTPTEYEMLSRDGADAVERWAFEWNDISGTMILIASDSWRAHHRPERCFEVYGLHLEDSRTHLVATDFPLRQVALATPTTTHTFSAVYWFQSTNQLTDDYATRIWADLVPEREEWVLTSILFDADVDASASETEALYLALRETIDAYLQR